MHFEQHTFCVDFTYCTSMYSGKSEYDHEFVFGYFTHHNENGIPILIILNTEEHSVSFRIESAYYNHSGVIAANNQFVTNFTADVIVSSIYDQTNGIYLTTSSDGVVVIGQNSHKSATTDTFNILPVQKLCVEKYIYYGVSVPQINVPSLWNSTILLVGTYAETTLQLTVTQEVIVGILDTISTLVPGVQYTFQIYKLQTVYIQSFYDLSGTKIVTDNPLSVFSGHGCAFVPSSVGACDHIVEQIPPTVLWGKSHYTAGLGGRRRYTIKVLAAQNLTIVDIFCNDSKETHSLNEGEFVTKILEFEINCAIHSNEQVIVAQFSHGFRDDNIDDVFVYGYGDPSMIFVPATIHYSNKFDISTLVDPAKSDYEHYANIVVLAEYYQPEMIYLIANGINKSLETEEWKPINVDGITEAYAAQVSILEGTSTIAHSNPAALMTVIVYGSASAVSYGHSGKLNTQGLFGKLMYFADSMQ